MLIGLHDAEKEYFKHGKTFPNYALMKISAWHKAQGDTVEWWNPLYSYDRVYSSKMIVCPDYMNCGDFRLKLEEMSDESRENGSTDLYIFPASKVFLTISEAVEYMCRVRS